ncbi:hypothetical protein V2G26_011907 [Clonostachys chloroleuca]
MRGLGAIRWLDCRLIGSLSIRDVNPTIGSWAAGGRRAFSQTSPTASAAQEALKKAQTDASSLTPEYVAANMNPAEKARLSKSQHWYCCTHRQWQDYGY